MNTNRNYEAISISISLHVLNFSITPVPVSLSMLLGLYERFVNLILILARIRLHMNRKRAWPIMFNTAIKTKGFHSHLLLPISNAVFVQLRDR